MWYESKDLLADLQKLVDQNVRAYKGDYDYDKETLKNSEETDFIWITRECGTHLLSKKNAYLKDTSEYQVCDYMLSEATVDVFLLHIFQRGDVITGAVSPVNPQTLKKEIHSFCVLPEGVSFYSDEENDFVPYEEYRKYTFGLHKKFDGRKKKYILSEESESLLRSVFSDQRPRKLKPFERLVKNRLDLRLYECTKTPGFQMQCRARHLLRQGANPNRKFNGYTSLHMAAYFAEEEMIHMLLEAGAKKTMKDTNGKTAYEIAKERHGREQILKMLE